MSAPTPILFVDRDGTLIAEPGDFQIDAYAKLRFVDGVIPALLRLRDTGWQFVMVTNQDGLGTDAFEAGPRDHPQGDHMVKRDAGSLRLDDTVRPAGRFLPRRGSEKSLPRRAMPCLVALGMAADLRDRST